MITVRIPSGPRTARAVARIARLMRGQENEGAPEPIVGDPGSRNRIWNSAVTSGSTPPAPSVPAWGTGPQAASEFVIDVPSRPDTIAGLTALGFGEAARKLADPFRIVVNKGGMYFYSFGDRKHLDLWIGWPSVTGLSATVVGPQSVWFGQTEGFHAIEVAAVDAHGTPVTFPLLAREPGSGSGFGAAIHLSSPREQQEFIAQIDRFYKERPTVSDTTQS